MLVRPGRADESCFPGLPALPALPTVARLPGNGCPLSPLWSEGRNLGLGRNLSKGVARLGVVAFSGVTGRLYQWLVRLAVRARSRLVLGLVRVRPGRPTSGRLHCPWKQFPAVGRDLRFGPFRRNS